MLDAVVWSCVGGGLVIVGRWFVLFVGQVRREARGVMNEWQRRVERAEAEAALCWSELAKQQERIRVLEKDYNTMCAHVPGMGFQTKSLPGNRHGG